MATLEKDNHVCLDWLKKAAARTPNLWPAERRYEIIALLGHEHKDALPWLQEQALQNSSLWARREAADAIRHWAQDPAILLWLEANKAMLPGPYPLYTGAILPPYWLKIQVEH